MRNYLLSRSRMMVLAMAVAAAMITACATTGTTTRTTKRDNTKKGAAWGAAGGAVMGAVLGEGEVDEILAGAVIGAGIGAGVGAYMDRQEEKLANIPGTTVERVGEDLLLIHFQSDLLFSVDSSTLNSSSQTTLEDVAGVLTEFSKTAVVIQGHTDSTGSETHNQSLSERRASSVRNYLLGRGIDPERMISVGYGEGHPVTTNDTPDGRQMNRRVDILLKAKAT
jgi:outer membrane protein OmpA-like peptidoglycan-associated protein